MSEPGAFPDDWFEFPDGRCYQRLDGLVQVRRRAGSPYWIAERWEYRGVDRRPRTVVIRLVTTRNRDEAVAVANNAVEPDPDRIEEWKRREARYAHIGSEEDRQ